jgi:hypothetical protein
MFGERKGKMMKQVTAGSFTGIDEVVFVYLFTEDGTTLYRGRDRTLAKLQPSTRYVIPPPARCLSLFALTATKDYIFGVSHYGKATWTQNSLASVAGAAASITVSASLGTIKTRIQNANFEQKTRGVTIVLRENPDAKGE